MKGRNSIMEENQFVKLEIVEEPKLENKKIYVLIVILSIVIIAIPVLGFLYYYNSTVEIPNVVGQEIEEVERYLSNLGILIEKKYEYSDNIRNNWEASISEFQEATRDYVEQGHIISMSPEPFSRIRKGDNVQIVISKGPTLYNVLQAVINWKTTDGDFNFTINDIYEGDLTLVVTATAPKNITINWSGNGYATTTNSSKKVVAKLRNDELKKVMEKYIEEEEDPEAMKEYEWILEDYKTEAKPNKDVNLYLLVPIKDFGLSTVEDLKIVLPVEKNGKFTEIELNFDIVCGFAD